MLEQSILNVLIARQQLLIANAKTDPRYGAGGNYTNFIFGMSIIAGIYPMQSWQTQVDMQPAMTCDQYWSGAYDATLQDLFQNYLA